MNSFPLELNSDNYSIDNLELKTFYDFINKYKFDLGNFLEVITYKDNAIFFGDMSSNTFYISNKLRDVFGFESNIVKDLLNEWRNRIPNKLDLENYDEDVRQILLGTRKIHDLVYKVRDIENIDHWISCQGKMEWKDGKPVFFAGKIRIFDNELDIDSVTKLQRKNIAKLKVLDYKLNKIGVIGFSFNNFSIINDSKGRDYTDTFIKRLVDSIMIKLDDKIYLYRMEGVKFLAIVNEKYLDETYEIAHEIKNTVNKEYSSNNFTFRNNINIGIYIAEKEKIMSENLLDIFDKLMATTKRADNIDKICSLSDEDILYRHYLNKMELELYRCVNSNFENFRTVVQPIVDKNNEITSAEILLRWTYDGETISPAVFIPILEKTGLICKVGRFVFEEAAKLSKEIKKYRKQFKIHINVSYIQILDNSFPIFIKDILNKYELTGEEIIVELTENNYDEDKEKVLEFTKKCNEMNIMGAIDDYGTGY